MNPLILAMDSTQIEAFLTCPRLWNYQYRRHLKRKDEPAQRWEAAHTGTYGHKIFDSFYKLVSSGIGRDKAYKKSIVLEPDEECPIKPENKAIVQEKLEMYNYVYTHSDFLCPSPQHVEVGFSHKLLEREDRIYIIEGRIDIMGAKMNNGAGAQLSFVDHKFQFKRHDLYLKRLQFRNYGLVCYETTGINAQGLVNYIRLTKKTDADTFVQKPICFLPGEHEWWRSELIKIYDRVAEEVLNVANPEFSHQEQYSPSWNACEGKYGICDFTQVCETPRIERQEHTIGNLYQIGKEWHPWAK